MGFSSPIVALAKMGFSSPVIALAKKDIALRSFSEDGILPVIASAKTGIANRSDSEKGFARRSFSEDGVLFCDSSITYGISGFIYPDFFSIFYDYRLAILKQLHHSIELGLDDHFA